MASLKKMPLTVKNRPGTNEFIPIDSLIYSQSIAVKDIEVEPSIFQTNATYNSFFEVRKARISKEENVQRLKNRINLL